MTAGQRLALLTLGLALAPAPCEAEEVVRVFGGPWSTCALTASGGVLCWGDNRGGQTFDLAFGEATGTPVPIEGLPTDIIAVAPNHNQTCALSAAGGLWCWNGTTGSTPALAPGLEGGVSAVAANAGSTFAVLDTGAVVQVWSDAPIPAPGLESGITTIDGGIHHQCAITLEGGAVCWGSNDAGQLGDGGLSPSEAPVAVSGLDSGVTAITAGSTHSCAIQHDEVFCWGSNYGFVLGVETELDSGNLPVAVPLPGRPIGIVAGTDHSCALLAGGDTYCWGYPGSGRLGDGWTFQVGIPPVRVAGFANGIQLTAGSLHTCGATRAGRVLCWGENFFGQLGNGSTPFSPVPIQVGGLPAPIVELDVNRDRACGIAADWRAWCWGRGLSIADWPSGGVPREVPRPVASASGDCAVTTSGELVCWGASLTYTVSHLEVLSVLPNGIRAVDGLCVLTSEGGVRCGDPFSSYTLLSIGLSSGATVIADTGWGSRHACALVSIGFAFCWGDNGRGQLGDGTTIDRPFATGIDGSSIGELAIDITVGTAHTCVVTTSGAAYCWGANYHGQLGDGTTSDRITPVAVLGLTVGVVDIAAGGGHTCAVKGDGSAHCWGNNAYGDLGDGTFTARSTPTPVVGAPPGGFVALDAGDSTCALTAGGEGVVLGEEPAWTARRRLPVAEPRCAAGRRARPGGARDGPGAQRLAGNGPRPDRPHRPATRLRTAQVIAIRLMRATSPARSASTATRPEPSPATPQAADPESGRYSSIRSSKCSMVFAYSTTSSSITLRTDFTWFIGA